MNAASPPPADGRPQPSLGAWPASSGVGGPVPVARPVLADPDADYRSGRAKLRDLARAQRQILWCVLAAIGIEALPFAIYVPPSFVFGWSMFLLRVAVAILIAVGVFRVLTALGVQLVWRILIVPLAIVPCLSLIALLVVNAFATNTLRKAGLKVRLMGVSDAEVVRRLSRHVCLTCGYSLIGNTSGVCPECGTPIPATALAADAPPPDACG